MLHGWVSQKMFAGIWNGYYPEENHVGYVTNGVHFPSWCATEWRQVYDNYLKAGFYQDQSNEDLWHGIYDCPDTEIWATRMALKEKLIKYIRDKFAESWLKNQGDPARVVSLLERITPNALMIGFCRRFATYKRAHLLFTDLERLSKIVNNPEKPVLFFFSGKAHPADGAGQGLIKRIYEISQRPEFLGKIIFLEDYDYQLARRLVSGVDIWMNTPTRPLEASGTSGEKAEMNGVVNLSVLDGWWVEGYRKGAGWALKQERTYENQAYQDQLDATTIYNLLENEIVPMYYDKDKNGLSKDWIQVVKNSIATIAPHYTMKRQLDDYYSKFYTKLAARSAKVNAKDYQLAKDIALWKETVAERWDSIEVVSRNAKGFDDGAETGKSYTIQYVINEQGLNDAVGLELVSLKNDQDPSDRRINFIKPFKMVKKEGNNYTFECEFSTSMAGNWKACVRMFPKNDLLPHRQDFCYVKWLD
jgi:starch phosphorylase